MAYEIAGEGRFRVNISRERSAYNIVLRVIPLSIKNFEELNLPSVLRTIASVQRGLVLVTGATGMGKSTTLATMLQEINRALKCKIVTIEDPVEFIFTHEHSIITQREIGTDTPSFPAALRAALRQDPDVIMVGEIRDAETVDTALKAAETGHAVFSSIHTNDVVTTLRRVVSFFPVEEHQQVRERLAENLQSIVSLRLLPEQEGHEPRARGRGAAHDPLDPRVHPRSESRGRDPRADGEGALRHGDADLRPAPARALPGEQDQARDRARRGVEPARLRDQARARGRLVLHAGELELDARR